MNNPLVFIHGAGDSAHLWRLQLEQLQSEYQVYAIDLPGHGDRPDTLAAGATVQDYAQAIHQVIVNELHLNRPTIVGHSLGGAIALTMALEYGSELGKLILISTGARIRVHPNLLEAARTAPEQARLQLLGLSVAKTTASSVTQSVVKEQAQPGPNILYRDLIACNTFDCMTRLHEIALPTLIVCGSEDSATPVKYSHYLHEHIAGSTLRIIPKAGHYVPREQPEAVNEAIREWLRSH
ncbi:MAG: alpha/beta fold hydrolase [Ktedonobacteraceae bacterium]|jgi:pimeloyl-ACP methyl ester carboxylesterase